MAINALQVKLEYQTYTYIAPLTVLKSSTKSISLFVTIPISLLPKVPSTVTGMPAKPCSAFTRTTSPTVLVGDRQKGSVMKPFRNWKNKRSRLVSTATQSGEGIPFSLFSLLLLALRWSYCSEQCPNHRVKRD